MGKDGHYINACGGAGVTHAFHIFHWPGERFALLLRPSGGALRFVGSFSSVERAKGAAEALCGAPAGMDALYARAQDVPGMIDAATPCDLFA